MGTRCVAFFNLFRNSIESRRNESDANPAIRVGASVSGQWVLWRNHLLRSMQEFNSDFYLDIYEYGANNGFSAGNN